MLKYKREDCHFDFVVNSYKRPQNFSNKWNGLVPMLQSTFAQEFLGLNIHWKRALKRLWRDIFNSGGSNGGLSVLSADVDWKCKLFPVEMSMNLSQVCLNWVRSMESKTNLHHIQRLTWKHSAILYGSRGIICMGRHVRYEERRLLCAWIQPIALCMLQCGHTILQNIVCVTIWQTVFVISVN